MMVLNTYKQLIAIASPEASLIYLLISGLHE